MEKINNIFKLVWILIAAAYMFYAIFSSTFSIFGFIIFLVGSYLLVAIVAPYLCVGIFGCFGLGLTLVFSRMDFAKLNIFEKFFYVTLAVILSSAILYLAALALNIFFIFLSMDYPGT